jgi:hypothetical protein
MRNLLRDKIKPQPTGQGKAGAKLVWIASTLLVERNWERGPGAPFQTKAQRFQATFDLFCWKYYLWGMKGNKPFLMKPSVVFTPLGTQIFIPG